MIINQTMNNDKMVVSVDTFDELHKNLVGSMSSSNEPFVQFINKMNSKWDFEAK